MSNNNELGMRLLPGVDLTLWLRLVLLVIAVAITGGVVAAVAS